MSLRYCVVPGCSVLVESGRCPQHAVRPNAAIRRWYYTSRWTRLRLQVLRDQAYTCAHCQRVQLRLEIDHIQPHHGDPGLFWSRQNLAALCPACHARKTRRGG